jgi:hypothetical protein
VCVRLLLLLLGDKPELLQQTQGIVVGSVLHYLALGEPLNSHARYLHPVARGGTKVLRLASGWRIVLCSHLRHRSL